VLGTVVVLGVGAIFFQRHMHEMNLYEKAKAAAGAHQGEYPGSSQFELIPLFRAANDYGINDAAARAVYNVVKKFNAQNPQEPIDFERALQTIAYNIHDIDGYVLGWAVEGTAGKQQARFARISNVMGIAKKEMDGRPDITAEFVRICPAVRDMLSPQD
jgi:hypothetical protein